MYKQHFKQVLLICSSQIHCLILGPASAAPHPRPGLAAQVPGTVSVSPGCCEEPNHSIYPSGGPVLGAQHEGGVNSLRLWFCVPRQVLFVFSLLYSRVLCLEGALCTVHCRLITHPPTPMPLYRQHPCGRQGDPEKTFLRLLEVHDRVLTSPWGHQAWAEGEHGGGGARGPAGPRMHRL